MTTDFLSTDYLYKEETDGIIAAFYEVYNTLGYGFLERVYQNALYLELQQRGFDCKAQYPVKVTFKGREVGEYYADILVNDCVILELKSVDTDIEVGLLLNFGEKPQVRRKIFTNIHK